METAPRNCKFLSLVVVELVLINACVCVSLHAHQNKGVSCSTDRVKGYGRMRGRSSMRSSKSNSSSNNNFKNSACQSAADLARQFWVATAFPKGPKIEKIQDRPLGLKFTIEIENFKRSTQQTPIFCGDFWRSGLKFSIEIEKFNRDWKIKRDWFFSIFGPLVFRDQKINAHFSRARKPWSAHCELKHWNLEAENA